MTTTDHALRDALEPCGNCGASARWVELAWRIKCTRPSCGVEGGKFETRREAVAAWNTRAPTPTPDGVEEAIARIIHDVMRWAADNSCTDKHPEWQGGNSFAEDKARDAARAILSLLQEKGNG